MAPGGKQISYFAAGPTRLPPEVLLDIQNELIYYENTNISVLEMSHRSKEFDVILKETAQLLKDLLNVPDNYKILFMQGGGTGQFSAIPMNLISKTGKADYIVTGHWSAKAANECSKYGTVNMVVPPLKRYSTIPPVEEWTFDPDASYVYYCDNETVHGIEFDFIPELPHNVPLVCDISSNICSRSIDVSKFGLIYAGAPKNIGCAGITVVIVREDLIGNAIEKCPAILDYETISKSGSLLNTMPVFTVYVLSKVLTWIKKNGGVDTMKENSLKKNKMIYSLIDESNGFYCSTVSSYRSRMNVPARIGSPEGDEELEKKFLNEATKEGLLGLNGHRTVGGIRISLYNAVSFNDVTRLYNFMKAFMARNH
jgi:phosphoserine aminotransferase